MWIVDLEQLLKQGSAIVSFPALKVIADKSQWRDISFACVGIGLSSKWYDSDLIQGWLSSGLPVRSACNRS